MKKAGRIFFITFLFFLAILLILAYFFLQIKNSSPDKESSFSALSKKTGEPVLQLALLADIHSDWEKLGQAVEQINNNPEIDLVLVLGDLTRLGSLQDLGETKTFLQNLHKPFYAFPGNHDAWSSKRDGHQASFNFKQVFGRQPACFSLGGLNFVLLNNSDENNPVPADHWQEILACLKKSEPIIFFSHEPLYHPANDMLMGKYSDHVASQADQLLDELCTQQAKIAVAAHLHSFSKYVYSCPDDYLLPMVIAPALTRERNFQTPRFLEIEIFNDGSFREEEVLVE